MRYQFKWEDVDPGAIPRANQANLEAVIHRALELGINHIETARGYGTSEMQLGHVLPELPRGKINVQTKVKPCATQKEFLEIFETSMKYLKLDHVDLLSLHGINNRELLDWSLRKNGSLAAARQLQKEGRARFIGFSTHATTDVILEAVNSGGFDYLNLHWYFVNDLNWSAVAAAHRQDMGVFIISPNDKGGKLYEPPPKLVRLCAPLTPMQFNDLYCLARKEVHTLSCGAAKPADFDEHVRALDFYDRIPETVGTDRTTAARGDGTRARRGLVRAVVRGIAQFRGCTRRDQRFGNFTALDVCEIAGSDRLGQDALQPAGPGGPLVSGPERGEDQGTGPARRRFLTARLPEGFRKF
jgi:uncharacterized protein